MSGCDNSVHVDVLVFEFGGRFLTRYAVPVTEDVANDPQRMAQALEDALRCSEHYSAGHVLICSDERLSEPLMVCPPADGRDVFAVTTAVRVVEDGAVSGIAGLEDSGCVGLFGSLDDAVEAICSNMGDMHELNRDIAIIERVDLGIYGCDFDDRRMFMWNDTANAYEPVAWPDSLCHTGGFAVE